MGSFRTFTDRMLNCHRSVGKLLGVCSKNPSTFLHSSGGGLPFLRSLSPVNNLQIQTKIFRNASTFSPTQRNFSALQFAKLEGEDAQGIHPTQSSYPYLMIPPSAVAFIDSDSATSSMLKQQDYCHFINLEDKKMVRIKKKVSLGWERELYSPDDSRCVGSSHGWLAMMDWRNCSVYLFNPFVDFTSFAFVPLPSIETFPCVSGVRVHNGGVTSPSSSSLVTDFICRDSVSDSESNRNSDVDSESSQSPESNNLVSEPSTDSDGSELDSESNGDSDYEFHESPKELTEFFIKKMVLSSAPSSESQNCIVMAIHGDDEKLAYCKPGGTTWTVLDGSFGCYCDVLYFDEHKLFYALDNKTESIEAWDFSDPSSLKQTVINPTFSCRKLKKCERRLRDVYCVKEKYLVGGSSGDVFLVIRFIADFVAKDGITPLCVCLLEHLEKGDRSHSYRTLRFDVYKLDFEENKWESVDCLGDRALFLGPNHSFSLSASEFPNLKGNCIYFTDDEYAGWTIQNDSSTYGGHDLGIYNYENNRITTYFPYSLRKIHPPPIWLAPNLL